MLMNENLDNLIGGIVDLISCIVDGVPDDYWNKRDLERKLSNVWTGYYKLEKDLNH